MAGFFDSLADSLENRLGDRPGETQEEMLHRKLPATSYADDLIGNIPQGLTEAGQDFYEAVTHPGQTAEGLAGYAMNPRQTASDIYQHYADRYRNLPTALETLRTDPVGVAGDILPFTALRGLARGATGAARRMRPSGVSGEVITPSAAREVGSTPEGWDFNGPRAAGPTIEGTSGDWESITGLRRTDRARPWKAPLFAEPRLNAADMPYRFGLEENMYRTEPPAIFGPSSQAGGATNYTSRTPLPRYTNYEAPVSTEMNPNIADLLISLRAEGRAPNRFEKGMLDAYFGGRQGQAVSGAMANMPTSVIPFGVQKTLNKMSEGIQPTRLEMMNLEKHFGRRVGLKSRAALEGPQMREAIYGPQADFRARMSDRILPPEEGPAGGGGRESLVRRALDVASRVAPRVGEGMMVGAPAGIATGLAYNAMRDSGAGSTPPVVPVTEREERPVTAAPFMSVVDPKYFAATDFEPSAGSDRRELVNAPMPPRRPTIDVERKGAPGRGGEPARGATPTRRPAPKRAAPQRERDTGKRYYGDYRDTEPFASDPIGQFIDELTGQRKMARKPGRQAPSSGGLGDLLPFADGGTVRRPFAEGGADNRIPILSDIGDAIGGMMQGGEQPAMAADRGSVDKENIFERWANNPLSQYLFAAGLGMMASPQANPLMAIGEGGLRGLEYMQAVQANADMRRKEREAAEERRRELETVKSIYSGNNVSPETAPSKSATVEVEAAQPNVAPVKTVESEPIKTAGKEPAATLEAPAPAATAAPVSTPTPVIASDKKLEELYNLNNKILNMMPVIKDPTYKAALSAKQRSVEAEITRVLHQKERAIQDARYQEQLNLQKAAQERQAYQSSEEGITKKVLAEEKAKHYAQNRQERQIKDDELSTLDQMEKIVNSPSGIHSGPTAGFWATAESGPVRGIITGKEAQKADNTRIFDTLTKKLVFTSVGGKFTQGFTDADRDFMMSLQPTIYDSVETTKRKIESAKRIKERELQILEKEREYFKEHGVLDENYYDELKKWAKQNPVFPELEANKEIQKTGKPSREELLKEQQRRREQRG